MSDKIFVVQDSWGFCIVCGKHNDLRYGHCFGCADVAQGEEDLCYFNGLGNFSAERESCLIVCKYSMKCRRLQKLLKEGSDNEEVQNSSD